MTTKINNAEGGTNGTAVTPANSGGTSGDAFGLVPLTGTGAIKFSTAKPAHGTLGYEVTPGGSSSSAKMQHAITAGLTFRFRFYIEFDTALVVSQTSLADFLNISSSVILDVIATGTGKISVRASGVSIGAGFTPTVNTKYRCEGQCTIGTTTANGVVNFNVYAGDGLTAVYSAASSSANLGTANINLVNYGKTTTTSTHTNLLYFDDLASGDGTAAYGVPGNLPPVADAGAAQTVEPWTLVTLDGTLSADQDGTIAVYAWTQTGGTAVTLSSTSSAQPTFTSPANLNDQILTFSLVVTDNGGAPSTADTTTVTILAATEFYLDGVNVWRPMQVIAL